MPSESPDDQVFAGVPDAFGRLWTPHRMAYIKGEGKPSGPGEDEGCPFCRAPTLSDAEGLIVARGSLVYAVLNLYPYNGGHVLICPYRHVADYTELTTEETAEFSEFTKRAVRALRQASGAQGFNIGMNLGSVAGAGIAAPPAPARGPQVGRRHQLHAGRRPHPRPAPAPGRHPQAPSRSLAHRLIPADPPASLTVPRPSRPRQIAHGCGSVHTLVCTLPQPRQTDPSPAASPRPPWRPGATGVAHAADTAG